LSTKTFKKQGKSCFDYSREELFKNIWDFVMENKGTIKGQCDTRFAPD
jgi:valyl-tRNA synthetase